VAIAAQRFAAVRDFVCCALVAGDGPVLSAQNLHKDLGSSATDGSKLRNMKTQKYRSHDCRPGLDRRDFVRSAAGACAAGSLLLGVPLFGQQQPAQAPETNIADFLKAVKTKHSLPGPFPGKVVEIKNPACLVNDKFDQAVVNKMVENGITRLTGADFKQS